MATSLRPGVAFGGCLLCTIYPDRQTLVECDFEVMVDGI